MNEPGDDDNGDDIDGIENPEGNLFDDIQETMHLGSGELEKLIATFNQAGGQEVAVQMIACQTFPDLIEMCGKIAREHGFWDVHRLNAQQSILSTITNLISRGYSAFENMDVLTRHLLAEEMSMDLVANEIVGDPVIFIDLIGGEIKEAAEAYRNGNWDRKDGVWEELADSIIRIFDFVARFGDKHGITSRAFLRLIQAKMAKNQSRPYLHGKNF